jgi:aspartyl-tRNA(Asn)/glutamyl-tRNA(Gln) amidotransferase subunit B
MTCLLAPDGKPFYAGTFFPRAQFLALLRAVDEAWRESVRGRVPELPMARFSRYVKDYGVGVKEAFSLVEEREACLFYEACIEELVVRGLDRARAGKLAANILLQSGAKRANEQSTTIDRLGITPHAVAAIGKLREDGKLGTQAVDELFGLMATQTTQDPAHIDGEVGRLAKEKGWLIVRDDAATEKWVDQVIAAHPKVAEDVRGGKVAAAGRLVGEVMKLAGGAADAKAVREMILKRLS